MAPTEGSTRHYPRSGFLQTCRSLKIARNQPELLQRRLQVFHNFLGDHCRGGQLVAVGQAVVFEPEDVQTGFVAGGQKADWPAPTQRVSRGPRSAHARQLLHIVAIAHAVAAAVQVLLNDGMGTQVGGNSEICLILISRSGKRAWLARSGGKCPGKASIKLRWVSRC